MKIISYFFIFIFLFIVNNSLSEYYDVKKIKKIKLYYIFFDNNLYYDIYNIKNNLNNILKILYKNQYSKEFYFNTKLDSKNINILINDINEYKPDYIILQNDHIFNDVVIDNLLYLNNKIIFISNNQNIYKNKLKNVFILYDIFDNDLFNDIINRYNIIFNELYFLCDTTRNCFLKYRSIYEEIQKNENLKKLKLNFYQFKNDVEFKKFITEKTDKIKNSIIINAINFIKKKNENDILSDEYINFVFNSVKGDNAIICFKEKECLSNKTIKYSDANIYQILNIINNDNYTDKINFEVILNE